MTVMSTRATDGAGGSREEILVALRNGDGWRAVEGPETAAMVLVKLQGLMCIAGWAIAAHWHLCTHEHV